MTPAAWVAFAAFAAIPTTYIYDGMPPNRYQGNAEVTVRFVNEPNAPDACGLAAQGTFEACFRNGVLILRNPCPLGPTESYARLTCHELAHRNGWPGKHGP